MNLDSDDDLQAYINELSKKSKLIQWEDDNPDESLAATSPISPQPVIRDGKANKDTQRNKKKTDNDSKIRSLENKYLKKNKNEDLDHKSDDISSISINKSDLDIKVFPIKKLSPENATKNISKNNAEAFLINTQNPQKNITSYTDEIPSVQNSEREFVEKSNEIESKLLTNSQSVHNISPDIPQSNQKHPKASEYNSSHTSTVSEEIPECILQSVSQKLDFSNNDKTMNDSSQKSMPEPNQKKNARVKPQKPPKPTKQLSKPSKQKNQIKPNTAKHHSNKEKRGGKSLSNVDDDTEERISVDASDASEDMSHSELSYLDLKWMLRHQNVKKSKSVEKYLTDLIRNIIKKEFNNLMIANHLNQFNIANASETHRGTHVEMAVLRSRIEDALRQSVGLSRQFLDAHKSYVEAYAAPQIDKFRNTTLSMAQH